MTTLGTYALDEPDLLALIAADRNLADRFREAAWKEAVDCGGLVHPSRVTARLKADDPDLNPRQLSALWSVATGRDGYLDNTEEWVRIDGSVSRGNGNKTVRLRRWRGDLTTGTTTTTEKRSA